MRPEWEFNRHRKMEMLEELRDRAHEVSAYLSRLFELEGSIGEQGVNDFLDDMGFLRDPEAMEQCEGTIRFLLDLLRMLQEVLPEAEKIQREVNQLFGAGKSSPNAFLMRPASEIDADPILRAVIERLVALDPRYTSSEYSQVMAFAKASGDSGRARSSSPGGSDTSDVSYSSGESRTAGASYNASESCSSSTSCSEGASYSSSESRSRAEPAPAVEMDKVQFSAVAPKALRPGEYAVIDLVMYQDAFRHVVDELLSDADAPTRETRAGAMRIAQGASVRVRLSSPDIEIADGEEVRAWAGDYLDFNFAVELPQNYAKRQVLFQASVFIDDVIASRLRFVAKCDAEAERELAVARRDILSAFMSYASQDRDRVAAIIQGMQKARPDLDIFFDVESLHSGEDWSQSIQREIERRDVLFLCWSRNARQSEWVEREWRYALERNGIDRIEPVPIEPPSVCPPPAELARKHFNDRMLYIINAPSGVDRRSISDAHRPLQTPRGHERMAQRGLLNKRE